MKKLLVLLASFVAMSLFFGCASTGNSEANDMSKAQIEQTLGKKVDWVENASIGKIKEFSGDEYVLYKTNDTLFMIKDWDGMRYDLNTRNSTMISSATIPNGLQVKDMSELKNGNIFVMNSFGSKAYIFQVRMKTYSEGLLQVKGNNFSLPSGTIRHLDRYAGWGYSTSNGGFEDVNGKQGIAGIPYGDGTSILYPWVYKDGNRFGLMIINSKTKLVAEYDLLLLGSVNK